MSATLKKNGGKDRFGTHKECLMKGYARGYNQSIVDPHAFLRKWSGRYKAHISQKLWHSDDPVLVGYQRATLNQSMMRGFAFGSTALAKQLARKAPATPESTPTLPLRATKP